MKKKVFKTAPLPFQGQKRRFAGSYALALSELSAKQELNDNGLKIHRLF